jgi:hypothetical protein
VAYFNVHNVPGGTEEYRETTKSGQPVSGHQAIELAILLIYSRSRLIWGGGVEEKAVPFGPSLWPKEGSKNIVIQFKKL